MPSNASDGDAVTRAGPIAFRKVYGDGGAASDKGGSAGGGGGPTYLVGTCLEGALIPEGYAQQQRLGELLREAYIGPEPHRLFATAALAALPGGGAGAVYLRSDDMQRTTVSGQALVSTFFDLNVIGCNPAVDTYSNDSAVDNATTPCNSAAAELRIIPWHTGDFAADDMYENKAICARLAAASAEAAAAPESRAVWSGSEAAALQVSLDAALGGNVSLPRLHDCLLTAVCAGKPLPAGVAAADIAGVVGLTERAKAIGLSYNGSYAARLAMAPLIAEILPLVQEAAGIGGSDGTGGSISGSGSSSSEGGGGGLGGKRFALFSGHDTTVGPLLAALAPTDFVASGGGLPPYASLLVIEVYTVANRRAYFRAVYNGRVLPLDGCEDDGGGGGRNRGGDLCDISALLIAMEATAATGADCSHEVAAAAADGNITNSTAGAEGGGSWPTVGGTGFLVGTAALCVALGAIVGSAGTARRMRAGNRREVLKYKHSVIMKDAFDGGGDDDGGGEGAGASGKGNGGRRGGGRGGRHVIVASGDGGGGGIGGGDSGGGGSGGGGVGEDDSDGDVEEVIIDLQHSSSGIG
ncbi:unnamed protein product [Phaeothamnion confervicola]